MLGTNDSIHLGGDDSSLPDAIHQLHSARVHVWTNQVKIVFGGGFHHWGLAYADQLEPNPKTKALEFWSDGQESKRLWPKSLAR